MTDLKIAVLGSGANGASIGADLIAAGRDVTLIEQWPAHVEAMRERGLSIRMPDRELHVRPRTLHLCEVATLRERFDVVLLLVKAYDSRWATQLISPYVAEDGVVAAVQNGMSTRAVAEVMGDDRTVGTVIEVSSTMVEPGVVTRHVDHDRSWFAVDASARRSDDVAALLKHSGTVARFDDIQSAKWMKLVSNSTVLVTTAITGLPMADAIHVPGMRELMVRAGQEALDVGRTAGYGVLPIFGLQPDEIARPESIVETMLDRLYDGFVRPGATTTVLQDWTKSRHSEVDDLNGTVVSEGKQVGVATPVNAATVAVAHRIERGELAPGAEAASILLQAVALN